VIAVAHIRLARQQLGEQLGKGAFGVVVKGLDITTGQFVAVKRLPREAIDEKKMMVRLSLSLSVLGSLGERYRRANTYMYMSCA